MIILLVILNLLIPTFLGSWFICNAMLYLKREKYFAFGIHIMLTIWEATALIIAVSEIYI